LGYNAPMPAVGRILPEKTPRPLEGEEHERLWAVFIHNDDVTPMDFVVHILIAVFQLPSTNAAQVMYSAHLNGKAYIQTLPRTEALKRVGQARFAAGLRRFPLEFSMQADQGRMSSRT
jgi:ATP-dependent Clp protease adaptor protein ClpS